MEHENLQKKYINKNKKVFLHLIRPLTGGVITGRMVRKIEALFVNSAQGVFSLIKENLGRAPLCGLKLDLSLDSGASQVPLGIWGVAAIIII